MFPQKQNEVYTGEEMFPQKQNNIIKYLLLKTRFTKTILGNVIDVLLCECKGFFYLFVLTEFSLS